MIHAASDDLDEDLVLVIARNSSSSAGHRTSAHGTTTTRPRGLEETSTVDAARADSGSRAICIEDENDDIGDAEEGEGGEEADLDVEECEEW